MDKETRDAFSTLAGGIAVTAERVRRAEETLARIEKLLTPPENPEPSPVVVLLEQIVAMMQQLPAAIARAVVDALRKQGGRP